MPRPNSEKYSSSTRNDLLVWGAAAGLTLIVGLLSLPALASRSRRLWTRTLSYPVSMLTCGDQGVALVGSEFSPVLSALDVARGGILWHVDVGTPISAPPAVYQDAVYVIPHAPVLMSLALDTGKRRWHLGPGFPRAGRLSIAVTPLTRAPPVVVDKTLYTVSTVGVLSRVDLSGKVVASLNLANWAPDRFRYAPVPSGNRLYLTSDEGAIWDVSQNLKSVRRTPLDSVNAVGRVFPFGAGAREPGFPSRYQVVAPALVSAHHLVVCTLGGELFGVSLGQGQSWRVWLGHSASLYAADAKALAKPLGTPSGVVVATRRRVVCVEPKSGRLRWWRPFRQPIVTNPVLTQDGLLLVCGKEHLCTLSVADGHLLRVFDLGATPTAGPVVSKGVVLLGFADGTVRAYSLQTVSAPASSEKSSAAIRMPR